MRGRHPTATPCVDLALGSDRARATCSTRRCRAASPRRRATSGSCSWEGDPARLGGRAHPLGIAVETRALGWNFPSGNEDIIYFVYTFYNITSTNAADYVGDPPVAAARCCCRRRADFQALNTAKYGINLPAGGYTDQQHVRRVRGGHGRGPGRRATTPASTCRSRWATPTSTTSARRRPGPRLDLRPGDLRLGAVLQRRRASSA